MKTKTFYPLLIIAIMLITPSCAVFMEMFEGRSPEVIAGVQETEVNGGSSWQNAIGGQAGIAFPLLNFSDAMGLRAEVNGSMQGARWEWTDMDGRVDLIYLNIPLVLRYRHTSGLYGEAGLQPGFLLSAKDKYEGQTDDFMSHMNKMDLSLPLGIGYQFKNNFGIGLRVIPGLNDISKDEDEKDSNFVIALRASYALRKRSK